ncbi:MAG: hypothetical protein JJE39_14845 [Vicinamibacteria bacterium]|nr:hypothetical protein [Vicinamibacteria bacterium]
MSDRAAARLVGLQAFTIAFLVLIANGRPIGSGDTNAMERTVGSLVEHGTVVQPDPKTPDPFTAPVPGGRVSIYPVLPALLATPLFFAFGLFFDLNPAGLQVAGKLSAALLAAVATAIMAHSYSRRTSSRLALGSALLFGLGTSVYSTSQALWQHPAVVLFMVLALDALARVETAASSDRLRPGLVASLCLSLAAVSRPAAIPISAALFAFLLFRARSHAARLVGVACVPAVFVAVYNTYFFGAPWRFGPGLAGRFLSAFPESIAGLLVSPARGLIVFTPIALIAMLGLIAAARRLRLARALLFAVFIHFVFVAAWNEWHGGESFGPRLLTDMLPALFFYLPEALLAAPATGAALGVLSVLIQLLGGWTYDYRWERLHQRGQQFDDALWSWRDSPLVFAVREGVVIQGGLDLDGRRLRARVHRSVPFGPEGSVVDATARGLRVSGESLIRDVRLERGARIDAGWMSLAHPADAVAFRSVSAGDLSLHLVGSLQGVVSVETQEGSTATPTTGDFDITVPLRLETRGDVYVRAQTGELRLGRLEVRSVHRP